MGLAAVWKPVAWTRGYHAKLAWLARIPEAVLAPWERSEPPHPDGKAWLTSDGQPWFERLADGTRGLTALQMGGGNSLCRFLGVPWPELEQRIRAAGEDPFTLPFDEILASGLLWQEHRTDALSWIEALPAGTTATEDIRAILGFLARQGDGRAQKALARQERGMPAPWVPFHVWGGEPTDTPSRWRRFATQRIVRSDEPLAELLALRADPDMEGQPFFFSEPNEKTGETLGDWAARHGIQLVTPELETLTPDPRINAWRDFLRQQLEDLRGSNTVMRFFYAKEIQAETGHMLPNGGSDLIHAALRPFAKDPEWIVYQHTFNRHAGETPADRYFVIERR